MEDINLDTPLSLRASFAFPLQSLIARRELAIGALWLLIPIVGWLLNMGHRIVFVHNMIHGREAMPAWKCYRALLFHGGVTFLGMLFYYSPAIALYCLYCLMSHGLFLYTAIICFAAATILIPGYMSHYCVAFDARQIFNVRRSCIHVLASGQAYWHAWAITLAALVLCQHKEQG